MLPPRVYRFHFNNFMWDAVFEICRLLVINQNESQDSAVKKTFFILIDNGAESLIMEVYL